MVIQHKIHRKTRVSKTMHEWLVNYVETGKDDQYDIISYNNDICDVIRLSDGFCETLEKLDAETRIGDDPDAYKCIITNYPTVYKRAKEKLLNKEKKKDDPPIVEQKFRNEISEPENNKTSINKFDEVFDHAIGQGKFIFYNQFQKESLSVYHNFQFNAWLQKNYKIDVEKNYDKVCTYENFVSYLNPAIDWFKYLRQFGKWLKKDDNLKWFIAFVVATVLAIIKICQG